MVAEGVLTGVPDRGNALIGIIWPFTTITLLTAILRASIRLKNRMFGWDDGFMVLAMLCFIGWSVVLTVYAQHGGLQHIGDVQQSGLDNVSLVLFLNWLSQVFGIMGVAFGKISVAALLLSIINLTELRWQKYFLWSVTIVLALLVAISCSILTFAQCSPANALWDLRVKGKCINPKVMSGYGTFTGSFNTFADASLAIIPATIFWKLNNSASTKVQLTIVFGLNILTSCCSGIKTQYLVELSNREDQTWATYDIFVWVTAELFLMIVCGAVPTLKPVLRFFKTTFALTGSTRSQSRKTATKLPSGGEEEHHMASFNRRPTKSSAKETTVGGNDSSDQLVDDGYSAARPGVAIGLTYDMKKDRH